MDKWVRSDKRVIILCQKRNEVSSYEKTKRKFKCILLHKRSGSEKASYCMLPTVGHFEKGKTT